MQEKKQNISPIKQRILYFIEEIGISKREFYLRTGISRGTIDNRTGITEDTLSKLFATFPDLNPGWIITDDGEMLKSSIKADNFTEPLTLNDDKVKYGKCQECADKQIQLDELNKTITFLREQIIEANKDKELYRNILSETKKGE